MKRKNSLLLILVICFAVLLAVSLVACNPGGGNNPSGDDPNNYETAKYTVTFVTNSDFVLANSEIKDIPSGTRISEPKNENGKKIIPIKTGYIFKYWSSDGSNEFDFNKGITANTKITALYDPIKYTHKYELQALLTYDSDNETFSVDERRTEDNLASITANTTLTTIYGSSSDKLLCPSAKNTKFCFWYYINSDGKPVQFTKWKAEGDSTVMLLKSYTFTDEEGLTLYPMFEDNLPKVTVKFVDSLDDSNVYDIEPNAYVFGQNIAYTKDKIPKPDVKTGYKFDYWYYRVAQTDTKDNVTYSDKEFQFDDGTKDCTPTSPMDAAGAADNFTPVELTLYAKWTREIVITNAQEYKELYDLMKKQDPTDAEKKDINEILSANIVFRGTIDFDELLSALGVDMIEPLFDSAHPFKGTIDGAVAEDKEEATEEATEEADTTVEAIPRAKLINGRFGNSGAASVFGYNEGTIRNLDFVNIKFGITDDKATRVSIGTVATDNTGTIEYCSVTIDQGLVLEGYKTVKFGGIAAENRGTVKGVIRDCNVNILNAVFDCEELMFGGIVSRSDASSSLTRNTANIQIASVKCKANSTESNSISSLVLGGIAGTNASPLNLCTVSKFEVNIAESLVEFIFGGVAGVNTGNIRQTYANATLGAKGEDLVKVRGTIALPTCIGGLIGKNSGYAINSYAIANLYVAVDAEAESASNLFVGGLIGSNYSAIKDNNTTTTESGICAVNYCYSRGEIEVNVANEIENVSVYAGGIAGRNSHKKLASLFSTVKIAVTNNGSNNLGHIIGKMLNEDGTNGKIFYDKTGVITLVKGGQTYEITGDGANSESYVSFANVGDGTDKSNFCSAGWIVGSDTVTDVQSVIKFSGKIWEVDSDKNDGYPIFKDDIYTQTT